VFVNATNRLYGSFYLSSPVIGDFESYITTDLVNKIDSSYRTLATRESRGIVGYSMGGWGAAHIALKFPNLFSVLVAEAGFYDSQSEWFAELSRQLGENIPSTLAKFDALEFPANAIQALFAGLLPNTERPPFFSDYIFEASGAGVYTNAAAIQTAREHDVQNGDLPRYAAQSYRLAGIKVVHGTHDDVVPIGEAISFTNALRIAGMPFAYEQHSGGHVFRADLAIPFAISNMAGAELYIEPPRLSLARTPNQTLITFRTKIGVSYQIESKLSLEEDAMGWTYFATIAGNGQIVSFAASSDALVRYFRVRAMND
jgi:hypothetical protein